MYSKFMGLGDCCTIKNAIKFGHYCRSSDQSVVQRFRCKCCKKTFSQSTFEPEYHQNKRQLNEPFMQLISSNISLRRVAKLLNINVKTAARKLVFCGNKIKQDVLKNPVILNSKEVVQFDELHTIEHTKLKPVAVGMMVHKQSRYILGLSVSSMPATGHLAKISRKKYGKRVDKRSAGLHQLFSKFSRRFSEKVRFVSDEAVLYKPIVRHYFPKAKYRQYKGQKSRSYGQGELKRGGRDPLFTINHTFAMCRANVNRLIRSTWCTTKRLDRLEYHLWIYSWYHNSKLNFT